MQPRKKAKKKFYLEALLFYKLASIYFSNIVTKKVIDVIRESYFQKGVSNLITYFRPYFTFWIARKNGRLVTIFHIIFLNDV